MKKNAEIAVSTPAQTRVHHAVITPSIAEADAEVPRVNRGRKPLPNPYAEVVEEMARRFFETGEPVAKRAVLSDDGLVPSEGQISQAKRLMGLAGRECGVTIRTHVEVSEDAAHITFWTTPLRVRKSD